VAYVKGSVERLLPLCSCLQTSEGAKDMETAARQEVMDANEFLAAQAFRVLAIAAVPYPVALGRLDAAQLPGRLVLLGLVAMLDPPREEARLAIQACKRAGIRVAMITGDSPSTAAAIAAELGICKAGEKATVGREIEAMDDEQLLDACRTQNVYARIEPLHKLKIVQAFKRDGHIAAMTGDGVNDAPALEAAGIGIAMGITGTDVAKEAADMVLADDNFASIVAAVEEGRIVFNRLRNVTFFLLMTGMGELMTLFLSVAFYGESPPGIDPDPVDQPCDRRTRGHSAGTGAWYRRRIVPAPARFACRSAVPRHAPPDCFGRALHGASGDVDIPPRVPSQRRR
jgi:Ca2+-transporting ATPase